MIKHCDLPDVIPVFPLPGALLLPRSRLPLHLFEPRYLAMFDDALKTSERLIGMIQPNSVPGRAGTGLHTIGCVGRITQFSETEDGRYMITLTGLSRYRVINEVDGFTPYRRAQVSWEGFDRDMGPTDADTSFDRAGFLKLLGRYFDSRELQTDWDSLKEADGAEGPGRRLQTGAAGSTIAVHAARNTGDTDRVFPSSRRRHRRDDAMNDDTTIPAFDRRMLEALVCPLTQARLDYDAEAQELISRGAKLAFPIRNGIPVMLTDEARSLD